MANRTKELNVYCKNRRDICLLLDEDEEVRQIGQTLIVMRRYSSVADHSFVYNMESGDAWQVGDACKDSQLIDKISDLDEDDLEKVRNFCVSAGLIK